MAKLMHLNILFINFFKENIAVTSWVLGCRSNFTLVPNTHELPELLFQLKNDENMKISTFRNIRNRFRYTSSYRARISYDHEENFLLVLPGYFISSSIGRCSGCNIAIRIDCNHSNCIMIFAIKFVAIKMSIDAIRIDWFVWSTKSRWIWFNILKKKILLSIFIERKNHE